MGGPAVTKRVENKPKGMTCSECGRSWTWQTELHRRLDRPGSVLDGTCIQCWMRRRKRKAGEPVPEAEWTWHTCPCCGNRWAMSDGSVPGRMQGYELWDAGCYKAHLHFERVMGRTA